MNDPMTDQATEGSARGELERSQFPHLTEFEWDALHLHATSSEAVTPKLLMQGTPDQHHEAAQGFLVRELAVARQRVPTPPSTRKEDVVQLDVSKYSSKGSKRPALNRRFFKMDIACEARQLRSELARSYFLLSKLTGKAREWALGKKMTDLSCFRTMDALKDDLRRAFEPVQDETQQRAALLKPKQGLLPMREYIQLARHLASCIVKNPIDAVTQVHVFVSGMKRVYLTRTSPASLEEDFDIALREVYNVQASNTFLFPADSSRGDRQKSRYQERKKEMIARERRDNQSLFGVQEPKWTSCLLTSGSGTYIRRG
ncbi:unnamed protein product [Phytophthora fragariaefolia]|uniref:Unnamed protein product n=1 Tax=Phytophthora fragariaefolia TaxID=1490495 RepID=A0A9W6YHX5_9STRA|nr:unnamed protein product [Phytophthora fragariaefolia]